MTYWYILALLEQSHYPHNTSGQLFGTTNSGFLWHKTLFKFLPKVRLNNSLILIQYLLSTGFSIVVIFVVTVFHVYYWHISLWGTVSWCISRNILHVFNIRRFNTLSINLVFSRIYLQDIPLEKESLSFQFKASITALYFISVKIL